MMVKVRILQDGEFSDFNIPGLRHRIGKQQLTAGTEIDYPDWYAKDIIERELAVVHIEPETQPAQLIDATNAAFRLAGELDVDLLTLAGSGAGGRITAGDVRKATQ